MIYGSVCSGIEAASVAWRPLGWHAAFLSEIDAFPRAVLAHHYPEVPLHGDFTTIREGDYAAIDVLVGGTPCQSFSVAGLRKGLDDERGNLALEYLRLAQRLRPKWLVWENVPGVLSSAGGRDFGSILGGLGELGYGFAYRVLDAQFVRVDGFARAVPQRRRRVFVVGYLGDWRRAAAVLFERASLSGNPAPRREAGKGAAPTLAARTKGGGGLGTTDFDCDGGLIANDTAATITRGAESSGKGGYAGRRQEDDINLVARCDTARQTRLDAESETFVACDSADTQSVGANQTTGFFGDVVAHTLSAARGRAAAHDQTLETYLPVAHALRADGFDASEDGTGRGTPIIPLQDVSQYAAKGGGGGDKPHVLTGWRVRRLMPVECERLQGFPDGYTAIPYRGKPAADGPRYKALGNSFAVNVVRWIGHRMRMVEAIP